MANKIVSGRGGIDTRDFKDAARALRKAIPETHKEVRLMLREAGELVADRARENAGRHSKTIADTIKVRTAGAGVEVRAGGADVPIAELYELGNTGHRKRAIASTRSTFRHPVFGNTDVWVEQQRFPYLAPAVAESAVEVEFIVGKAMDRIAAVIVGER